MKRLRWHDFLWINLFWLGLNIRNTAMNVITPGLLENFVDASVKNTALGVINSAGLVIAMLVQPAAGLLSDRSTSRFGRRRPFIFVGVLLDLLFLAAVGLSWGFWPLLLATLLLQFSANVSHGPLQGLIPDLVADEDKRGRASAVKAVMELVAIFVVGITIAKIIEAGQMSWAIVVTGATLLVVMLLTVLLVKEEPLREKPTTPFWPPLLRVLGMLGGIVAGAIAGFLAGGILGGLAALIAWPLAGPTAALPIGIGVGGVVAMVVSVVVGVWAGALITLDEAGPAGLLRALRRARPAAPAVDRDRRRSSFIWWVVNRLMFLAAITSIQKFTPYFLEVAFKVDYDAAAGIFGNLMAILGPATIASALLSGWLADRMGHKRLVGLSGLLAALGGLLLLVMIWLPSMPLIYAVGAILGISAGLFMTSNWAMGTDLAPPAEAGLYLGVSNLAGAGAGMVGTGIGGLVVDWVERYSPGLGYFPVFAAFALLFALSTVTLLGVRSQHPQLPLPSPRSGAVS